MDGHAHSRMWENVCGNVLSSDSLTVIHGLSLNIGSEIGIKTFSIREFRKESIRLLSQICEWLRAHKDEPGGLGVQRAAGRRC